jgi:hypothetical protein
VATIAASCFVLLAGGLGTMAVGSSVSEEFADHTWDQQRMSAMAPWAMTWGKLAGGAGYAWYGAALCLLVGVPAAWLARVQVPVLTLAMTGVLAALLMHASQVSVTLQLSIATGRSGRRNGVGVMLLFGAWLTGASIALLEKGELVWWGMPYGSMNMLLVSMAFFAICAVVMAWRSMAAALAVRQVGWGWPVLALVITVYIAGFIEPGAGSAFMTTGILVSAVMTYVSLLTEPQSRAHWSRLLALVQAGRWGKVAQEVPRWVTSLLLAVPFAVSGIEPITDETLFGYVPLVLLLLLVRDCALALFFAFSPTGRRKGSGFLLLMAVLYGLLPWLLGVMQASTLLNFVLPLTPSGGLSIAFAMVHVVAALALLRWRWKTSAVGG